ncbi:MAG: glucose-inhibited division protein B [Marinobacter sp.]|nr:glucose-inhibited division protein B [Marinobacter sp.]
MFSKPGLRSYYENSIDGHTAADHLDGLQREPQNATLAELVAHQTQYDNQWVITSGVVRGFEDPEHYWIEDDQLNRVSVEPQALIQARLGEQVQVLGRFLYSPQEGRRITAAELVAPSN